MSSASDVDAERSRRRLARNIPVYYLFYGVSGFLIWMPIWVIYLQEFRGMSLTQIGSIEAVFWITVVVAEVPTGAVADRWGRRVSLATGGAMFCVGSVVFAFSSTYVVLLVAYLTIAVAMTMYSGAGHALVYDTLRQLGRAKEYEKHIGRSEAMAFGSLLAARVASRLGERRSLVIPLVVGGLILLAPTLWDSLWVVGAIGLLAVIRGMTRPIATGYINRRIPSDQRATVLSMFELSAALLVAIILPQAGTVADAAGFQASFGLLLVILIGAGALFALIWRLLHGREQARLAFSLNSMTKPQARMSR